MHCLLPSVTCLQCDFPHHSGSLCVRRGLRTLEKMKVKVIPPQASRVISGIHSLLLCKLEANRSRRTEEWVRKCWVQIMSQKVLFLQRTNEGGQTGYHADPTSRTLACRAMGTAGSWKCVSIPTPTPPQTSQPTGRKGLVWLTFQRFYGSLVPCTCDLRFLLL